MKLLMRSDERLIHDKLINEWCKYYNFSKLLIADNRVANDVFMTNVYKSLVPLWIDVEVCKIDEAQKKLQKYKDDVLLLCATPVEALQLIKSGIFVDEVSLADKRYMSKKIKIPKEYKQAVNEILTRGVLVSAQVYPENKKTMIEIYADC